MAQSHKHLKALRFNGFAGISAFAHGGSCQCLSAVEPHSVLFYLLCRRIGCSTEEAWFADSLRQGLLVQISLMCNPENKM